MLPSRPCRRSTSDRLYQLLLALYPANFREEYGREMAQMFRDDYRQSSHRGAGRVARLWLATTIDLLLTAPGAHMEILVQDLRYCLRTLLRQRGFALTAVLTLSLGIGANTAIFSIVNSVLLQPLPYRDPGRLIMLWEKNPRGIDRNGVSPGNFDDFRREGHSLEGMSAYYDSSFNLSGIERPERVLGFVVSSNLFEVLGVPPLIGRGFQAEDEAPGAQRVAALSYGLWQRRFGGSTAALGASLVLNGNPYTVVGVMPAWFGFPSRGADLWTPMGRDLLRMGRSARFLSVVARLAPGAEISRSREELALTAQRLSREFPRSNQGWGVTLLSLQESLVGDVRSALLILCGAVGCVLLIACANVANLLLARGISRQREMAMRAALGANRLRLVRQLTTENVVLALLGGGLGLILANLGLYALVRVDSGAVPRLQEITVDGRVLTFTAILSVLTGMAFGLLPSFRNAPGNLSEALCEIRTSSAGPARTRLRSGLIVAEVALSVILLNGAGLLTRSLARLYQVDPGFDTANVLTLNISLPAAQYREALQQAAFYRELLRRLEGLPGVRFAGATSNLPLTGAVGVNRFGFTIEGAQLPAGGNDRFYARWITPGYFRSMGIPLLQGRDFGDLDQAENTPAAIIDRTLAARYFRNENPLGQRIRTSYAPGVLRTIVGVVGDVRQTTLDLDPAPHIYIPYLQEPRGGDLAVVLRAESDPLQLIDAARREVREIDRNLPVYDIRKMDRIVAASLAQRRFSMFVLGLFAAAALAMSAIGLYGVISFAVNQRVNEIGIRLALGAQAGEVLRLILFQGARLVGLGLVIGLVGSLAATRFLSSMLFGISISDPITYSAVSAIWLAVGLLACYFPARRMMAVDPVVALRHE